MKKWVLAAGLCLAFFFQRCSTDFDLNADFKETPVIYALLSVSDSVHYIRINRAFLDDTKNAYELASDPNQIYYGDELTVLIEEINNDLVVNTFAVERVDGDTLGMPKETEGVFASLPNILYRFKAELNTTHEYRITVTNTLTSVTATAQTPIIDTFKIKRPDDDGIFPFSVSMSSISPFQVRWIAGQDAKIYDLTMRVFYRNRQYDPTSDVFTTISVDSFDWKFKEGYVAASTTGGGTLTYDIPGLSFYKYFDEIFDPIADNNFFRFADSVQFIIDAGGDVLYNFQQYNLSNLGITEGQLTATYTNVSGGLGIFSSRYHKVGNVYAFSAQTIDSIACGSNSAGLNFASNNANPTFPYCE